MRTLDAKSQKQFDDVIGIVGSYSDVEIDNFNKLYDQHYPYKKFDTRLITTVDGIKNTLDNITNDSGLVFYVKITDGRYAIEKIAVRFIDVMMS